ncbi:MAG TPA: enoyl-CoA hydratase-related protein [Trebonia sp.]|jgi:enoyl-CoA hydratase|nr:enoyl-CoA hydratase-related protein [Trebonia sp.]
MKPAEDNRQDHPDGRVTVEVQDMIALVTLDRPQRHNAITPAMLGQLAAAAERLRADDGIRVAVLTGAGTRAFCAGGDLAQLIPRFTAGHLDDLIPDPTQRFFSRVYKPIIAAVRGYCIAGGLEILLGTDLRVASEDAVFGLAETHWGIVPGAGSHIRLPQQVPWAIAMQLVLTAEPVDARRAYEVGLVNEVRPADEVLPRALELARLIAANGPLAVQAAKESAVRGLGNESRFALDYDITQRVMRTEDAREGPRAFAEKRTPQYRAR